MGAAVVAAGHNYIGTEHILMGLLREGEGVAARVLETLGADQAKIRTQVRGGAACGLFIVLLELVSLAAAELLCSVERLLLAPAGQRKLCTLSVYSVRC